MRRGKNIYNIKELQKINFYEKIVEYYQTSFKNLDVEMIV